MPILTGLGNAQTHAKLYPNTFTAPSDIQLNDLTTKDFVKISRYGERFWVQVHNIDGTTIEGIITSRLVMKANEDLKVTMHVTFEKPNIYLILQWDDFIALMR